MNQVKVSHYLRVTHASSRGVSYRAVYTDGTEKHVTAQAAGYAKRHGYQVLDIVFVPASWVVRILRDGWGETSRSRSWADDDEEQPAPVSDLVEVNRPDDDDDVPF